MHPTDMLVQDGPKHRSHRIVCGIVRWVFGVICLFGFAAAAFTNVWWISQSKAGAAACAAFLVGAISSPGVQRPIAAAWARLAAIFERRPSRRWVGYIVGAGVLLRVLWVCIVPPIQQSDMAAYFELARALARGGDYILANDRAFWPPGLPLSLTPTLWLLGAEQWVPAVNNIALFVVAAAAVFALAARVSGRGWAVLALSVVALWPNWILLSGLASKELLLGALLSTAVWLHLGDPTWKRALVVGLMCGGMALTQPSTLFIPAVFVLTDLIRRLDYRAVALRALILVIAMIAVVAPWTVRNAVAMKQFIPVSLNGGVTLWVGNNPNATGQFVEVPERIRLLPEVERDRVARTEALKYMREHPARVLRLAIVKQAMFWADDAKGAYETLRRPGSYGTRWYVLAKGISNMFWIALLASLVAGTLRSRHHDPTALLLMTTIACLLTYVQSFQLVFEGDGRFHTPMMPLLAVALVCSLSNGTKRTLRQH